MSLPVVGRAAERKQLAERARNLCTFANPMKVFIEGGKEAISSNRPSQVASASKVLCFISFVLKGCVLEVTKRSKQPLP
jgi:hypothetical protein